jgi:hypothetical protein
MPAAARRGEIALLLFGVLAALVLGELLARAFGRVEVGSSGYPFVDTRSRWSKPTNSRGYRDDEHAQAKPGGVRRLVCLGDSFAWGAGMEYDDAFPKRLERALARRRGERWEAVNLALPGMNTVEQAAQLREEGLLYSPDVVVLGYVLNDAEDENSIEARRARDWEERRRAKRARREGLLERSALYRLVRSRLEATLENRRRIASYHAMYAPDYSGWKAAQQALEDMSRACRERSVPFVVAIFPLFGNPLGGAYPFADLHGKVAQAATQAGARAVDLLPAYRGLRWELLTVNGPADEHPNEIAHRIAANEIIKALEEVLPPPKAAPSGVP